ncbi:hypothetical protein DNTS_004395 [Danionella cerebrum]|uniref:Coiled-coil domain-containing protein 112 n=1 Tax=Danionella cerebrum TaxID=2873325 RepID=A0A553NH96_9TELE|nr:hypothetical protein DNTS_004395 [Danionella translucida]
MNQERKDDGPAFKVQQQLTSLRNEVFRFQEQLMDLRPSPDAFEKLKETMISIESSIGAFKDMQHQRFEQLLRDECLLQQEISICDQQLELWSLPQAAVCPVTQTHSLSQMHTFPKEVRALQSFLQASGGRCGGWEEQEHQRFLRIYRKCTGKAWNLSDLQQNLPGRSQEELKEHWLWTDTLNRLQQGQREAIKKWRTLRVQQQQAELNQQQQFENQELQERQGCLERLQLESELRRKEEKEALQAWRNQRNQEQQEKRQMHIRLITQQHRRNREEQRRREEQKLKHQEQVTRKKIKEEEEKRRVEEEQRKEREERRRLAEENIPRFQDRDRTLLNQKRQQQQNREQQQLEQQQRLQRIKSKVEVQVSRDSSRILKRTAVWQERMKLIGPSDTSGAIPLSQTYRRAVPSWRRDL